MVLSSVCTWDCLWNNLPLDVVLCKPLNIFCFCDQYWRSETVTQHNRNPLPLNTYYLNDVIQRYLRSDFEHVLFLEIFQPKPGKGGRGVLKILSTDINDLEPKCLATHPEGGKKKQALIQFAEFSSRLTWIPVACRMFSDRSFFQICSAVTLRFISCEGLVQFTRIPERHTWHAHDINLC